MQHASTRDLYGYWNRRRGARVAPERADIDPTAIPRVLADTFLLRIDAAGEPCFRLAGTRVCALFCRELKGETFLALFDHGSHDQIEELLDTLCHEPAPTVAGVTGHFGDRSAAELELLLLPLSYGGRTDARVLGVLVPVTAPYWLGALPVTSLSLGNPRQIDPFDRPTASPLAPLHHSRLRYGLTVYDGGRR